MNAAAGPDDSNRPGRLRRSPRKRAVRTCRILAVGAVLPLLFSLSQSLARARGQAPVPGLAAAFGVLGVLFLARAAATESSRGEEFDTQKDFLWGAGLGALAASLLRLAGLV